MPDHHHGRGRQAPVAGVPARPRADHQPLRQDSSDLPLLRHVPRDGEVFLPEIRPESLQHQPHGGADPPGHHPVLRLRRGAAEGPLPQHPLLQARDQPVHHLLQLGQPRRAPGQEDYRARILLLLHPRQDAAGQPQPRLPRVPQRRHPPPRHVGPVHARYRHPVRQRRYQLRLPQELRDLPAPHRPIGTLWPPRSCRQPHHVRGSRLPPTSREGAGHRNPPHPRHH
mmetsp:Transcript_1922/g.4270  ORF Transcript_1922/g.4270 Transcript_1922/m.4270 type:complete len:226 (+) Transcript_1922:789-1466(+)